MTHIRGVNLVLRSREKEAGLNCEDGERHLLGEENALRRKEWGRARPAEGPWGGNGERGEQEPRGSSGVKKVVLPSPQGSPLMSQILIPSFCLLYHSKTPS